MFISDSSLVVYEFNNKGFLWDPPRVPTYYNFAWVPHTFEGVWPLLTLLISHTGVKHTDYFHTINSDLQFRVYVYGTITATHSQVERTALHCVNNCTHSSTRVL